MGDMFYSVAPISRYDCNEEFQLFGRESIWVGHSGKHVSGLYLMRPFSL
jgi:hypothetical protein